MLTIYIQLLENDVVLQIAKKYNKTAAQVLLRWGLDQGVRMFVSGEG